MKCCKKIILIAAIVFAVSSCYAQLDKQPAPLNKALLLQLVNKHRSTGCNCGSQYFAQTTPVVWNDSLELAAHDHALDMYVNIFFSHTGSNGSGIGDRAKRRNYNWKSLGENISLGRQTEEDVIKGWMNSPGHCSNIMSPNYKEMGVSRAGNYWTMVLGSQSKQ